MRRKYNPRMIKRHFTYTIKEISVLFGTCEKTIQRWIAKEGLAPIVGSHNPYLIAGDTLSSFLVERKKNAETSLQPNEFYCVKCRTARKGKLESIKVVRTATRIGRDRIMGIKTAECETCTRRINRFFAYRKDESNEII